MPTSFPLEDFKAMLREDRVHLSLGIINRLSVAGDRSFLKVYCNIISDSEDREIIADMSWEVVGPDSGDYQFPAVGDMVMIAYVDADVDLAFVIKRMSSIEDSIPQNALSGDRVIKSLKNKNIWVTAQNELYLTKADAKPQENLILGQVFKKFAGDLIDQVIAALDILVTETHTSGMPGYITSPPTQASMYTAVKAELNKLKANPIDNEDILSGYAFTSKE